MAKIKICLLLLIFCLNTLPAFAANELTPKELCWKASSYEDKQDYNSAIKIYSKVLEMDGNYIAAYAGRARAYEAVEKYDLALSDYTKCVELDPSDPGLFHNRGNFYRSIQEFDLAIVDYTHAIELGEIFFTRKARGDTYVRMHQYDLAMIDFNRMAELWPHDSDVYLYKTQLYGLLGDYDKAMEECNIGLKEYPEHPILLFDLGQCYELLDNKELAIQFYSKAMNNEMQWLSKKKTTMPRNKINARLVGDWESYPEWMYY